MINWWLQPDAELWDVYFSGVQSLCYLSALATAGLAIFAIIYANRIYPEERFSLERLIMGAGIVAVLLISCMTLMTCHSMSDGDMLNPDIWQVIFTSRMGNAMMLRLLGLVLILLPLLIRIRLGQALAGTGVFLVALSFAVMGHASDYEPSEILTPLIVLHVLVVAFWIGSLVPLIWLARRADADAYDVIESWSAAAMVSVAVIVVTGAGAALLLIGDWNNLLTTDYGKLLIFKLTVFGLLLWLAAWHKFALTPPLAEGSFSAGRRLARSIGVEFALMFVALVVVSDLVHNTPPVLDKPETPEDQSEESPAPEAESE